MEHHFIAAMQCFFGNVAGMFVIREHGDGEWIIHREDRFRGGAIAAEVVENYGEARQFGGRLFLLRRLGRAFFCMRFSFRRFAGVQENREYEQKRKKEEKRRTLETHMKILKDARDLCES